MPENSKGIYTSLFPWIYQVAACWIFAREGLFPWSWCILPSGFESFALSLSRWIQGPALSQNISLTSCMWGRRALWALRAGPALWDSCCSGRERCNRVSWRRDFPDHYYCWWFPWTASKDCWKHILSLREGMQRLRNFAVLRHFLYDK